jgi:hypothetical protein
MELTLTVWLTLALTLMRATPALVLSTVAPLTTSLDLSDLHSPCPLSIIIRIISNIDDALSPSRHE